jgi:hypothetical protein
MAAIFLGLEGVAGAAGTIEQARSHGIADDFFFNRIPADGAANLGRDDVEVADGGATVAGFDVGDGALTGADAVEKISVMIVAGVKVDIFGAQGTIH